MYECYFKSSLSCDVSSYEKSSNFSKGALDRGVFPSPPFTGGRDRGLGGFGGDDMSGKIIRAVYMACPWNLPD